MLEQVVLGLLTWAVLITALARETPLVRAQTGVVVVLATVVEYTFSPLLEAYTYRLENVPVYVPPGPGPGRDQQGQPAVRGSGRLRLVRPLRVAAGPVGAAGVEVRVELVQDRLVEEAVGGDRVAAERAVLAVQ